jgi:hypothetical protein
MTKPSDNQISELCILTTRDEAGRHFAEWSEHFEALEEMGLIDINRPVHEATGIDYDQQYWTLEITEEGIAIMEANPELHPVEGASVEDIGGGFFEAEDGTVIYSPEA